MGCPFFHDYDQFLEIEILSKDLNEFHKWKGLIQARLRYLVGQFEQDTADKIIFQLWPQEFNLYLVHQAEWKYASFYYIGVKTSSPNLENVDLTSAFRSWKKAVFDQWDGEPSTNDISINPKRRSELDKFVYNYNPVTPSAGPPKGFLRWEENKSISSFEREPSNILSKIPADHQSLAQVNNNLGLFMSNFGQGQPPMGLLPFPQHLYGSPNIGSPPMGVPKAPFGSSEFYGDPNNPVPPQGFTTSGTRSPPGQLLGPSSFPIQLLGGYLPKQHPLPTSGPVSPPNGFLGAQGRPHFAAGLINQPNLPQDGLLPGQPGLPHPQQHLLLGVPAPQPSIQLEVETPFSPPGEPFEAQKNHYNAGPHNQGES